LFWFYLGFAPSEFVSSRDKKKTESFRQRPEDFMDDEVIFLMCIINICQPKI